ncbi:MAG: imidazole glycerol phosphate synthase subunit HisH [Gemmataceae bacterium]|nr:imidazole glycerol phosphate synthase subunit HisH [Gemmataceae bacterium]
MKPIVIVDYGMANLRSVQKAFEKLGHAAVVSGDANQIAAAPKVVLPGVGAFRDGIGQLRATGLVAPLVAHVRAGKPFLGICLGMQMLFTRSLEDGEHLGLDLLPGDVVCFPERPGFKVPHMGWNQLRFRKPAPLFRDLNDGDAVYFVHSYYPVPSDRSVIAAEAEYPTPFAAAIWHENILATQFHPEKSQRVGLMMLRNFAAM